jgi:hypothetical protein
VSTLVFFRNKDGSKIIRLLRTAIHWQRQASKAYGGANAGHQHRIDLHDDAIRIIRAGPYYPNYRFHMLHNEPDEPVFANRSDEDEDED